jgi:hypothetical protein
VTGVGPDAGKHIRNILILIGLAVVVWKVPGGGQASATISNLLSILLIGGLLFFGYRLYMEHRDAIFGLEDRQRAILYASVGLATITFVATNRMWSSGGLGALAWMALLGIAGYGVYGVWRSYRTY